MLADDAEPAWLSLYEAYADQAAFRTHAAGASHLAATAVLRPARP